MSKRRLSRHVQQPRVAVDLTQTVPHLFIRIANQQSRRPLSERENDNNIDPVLLGQSQTVLPHSLVLESSLKRVIGVLWEYLIVESDRKRKQYSGPFCSRLRLDNRFRAHWKFTSFTTTTCFRRPCMEVENPLSNLAKALSHYFWSSHIGDVFLSPERRPNHARGME